MRKPIILLLLFIISVGTIHAQQPDYILLQVKAPEYFKAEFKTSKGSFVIEANRKWSPMGVDRLYQLITSGFFTNALFFRVEQNYVVQFGIASTRPINRFWDPKKLIDEPAQLKNTRGTISFARGGKNERATQLFINTVTNTKLDTITRGGTTGYTPVARVISGMEIVAKLNGRYGKKPATEQDSLYKYGNIYFEQHFPGLDRIVSVSIIK
jgi:peptidyl-prolyl cis-trans isomerase A (cyclophilin A)